MKVRVPLNLAKKFLNKNPQFRGLSFYWDKEHCILTYYRNAPGLGPTTSIKAECRSLLFVFRNSRTGRNPRRSQNRLGRKKAADIISLAIYFLVHPHLNIDSYFHTAERTLLPGQPLSAKGCTELLTQ